VVFLQAVAATVRSTINTADGQPQRKAITAAYSATQQSAVDATLCPTIITAIQTS